MGERRFFGTASSHLSVHIDFESNSTTFHSPSVDGFIVSRDDDGVSYHAMKEIYYQVPARMDCSTLTCSPRLEIPGSGKPESRAIGSILYQQEVWFQEFNRLKRAPRSDSVPMSKVLFDYKEAEFCGRVFNYPCSNGLLHGYAERNSAYHRMSGPCVSAVVRICGIVSDVSKIAYMAKAKFQVSDILGDMTVSLRSVDSTLWYKATSLAHYPDNHIDRLVSVEYSYVVPYELGDPVETSIAYFADADVYTWLVSLVHDPNSQSRRRAFCFVLCWGLGKVGDTDTTEAIKELRDVLDGVQLEASSLAASGAALADQVADLSESVDSEFDHAYSIIDLQSTAINNLQDEFRNAFDDVGNLLETIQGNVGSNLEIIASNQEAVTLMFYNVNAALRRLSEFQLRSEISSLNWVKVFGEDPSVFFSKYFNSEKFVLCNGGLDSYSVSDTSVHFDLELCVNDTNTVAAELYKVRRSCPYSIGYGYFTPCNVPDEVFLFDDLTFRFTKDEHPLDTLYDLDRRVVVLTDPHPRCVGVGDTDCSMTLSDSDVLVGVYRSIGGNGTVQAAPVASADDNYRSRLSFPTLSLSLSSPIWEHMNTNITFVPKYLDANYSSLNRTEFQEISQNARRIADTLYEQSERLSELHEYVDLCDGIRLAGKCLSSWKDKLVGFLVLTVIICISAVILIFLFKYWMARRARSAALAASKA